MREDLSCFGWVFVACSVKINKRLNLFVFGSCESLSKLQLNPGHWSWLKVCLSHVEKVCSLHLVGILWVKALGIRGGRGEGGALCWLCGDARYHRTEALSCCNCYQSELVFPGRSVMENRNLHGCESEMGNINIHHCESVMWNINLDCCDHLIVSTS